MPFIQISSRWQSTVLTKSAYISIVFQQLAIKFSRKGYCFLSAQSNIWVSVGLDYDQEEVGGARKETGWMELRGHRSSGDTAGSVWPPGSSWAVPHLGAAVFLDPAGVRPVGDPNCLGSGEQREVKWAGSRPGRKMPRKHM